MHADGWEPAAAAEGAHARPAARDAGLHAGRQPICVHPRPSPADLRFNAFFAANPTAHAAERTCGAQPHGRGRRTPRAVSTACHPSLRKRNETFMRLTAARPAHAAQPRRLTSEPSISQKTKRDVHENSPRHAPRTPLNRVVSPPSDPSRRKRNETPVELAAGRSHPHRNARAGLATPHGRASSGRNRPSARMPHQSRQPVRAAPCNRPKRPCGGTGRSWPPAVGSRCIEAIQDPGWM